MRVDRHPGTGTWRARRSGSDSGRLGPVLCVVVIVVLGMGGVAIQRHQTQASSAPATKDPTPRAVGPPGSSITVPQGPVGQSVPLGVYTGPGSQSAAMAFTDAIGTGVTFALDYLDDASWQAISDPEWFLHRWAGSGFQMIWAIPMLPRTGGSMASGASGAYDASFAALAQNLVANGQGSSVIMPGWDPDLAGFNWSVSTVAEASQYVAYFQQIVTTMRAVQGESFRFAWDVSGGGTVSPPALYPGNSYVDVMATDAFDRGPGTVEARWAALSQSSFGLDWIASFALQQHKPLMLAKWGLAPAIASGGGDDPAFVDDLLSWARQQHVVAAVTWDYGSWALTGGSFPTAAAELRKAVGGVSGQT